MPVAVDVLHGGDVGLAAKAAATRGSRPNGLSPSLGGIEVHMDSPPTPLPLGCEHKPLLAPGQIKSAPAGQQGLTEMSDV